MELLIDDKIIFEDWNPREKTIQRLATIGAVLAEYEAEGYRLTLRQLYYQLVARGVIANQQAEYDKLGTMLVKARKAGLVSWNAIEDRTRNLSGWHSETCPASAMQRTLDHYRENHWITQPYVVECWVEKEALANVVERACSSTGTPWLCCRGYMSVSEKFEAGYRRIGSTGKPFVILYLGDHDPSGLDMPRELQASLNLFSESDPNIHVIALTRDQVDDYNPPPNPAKESDVRHTGYMAEHGGECWELDALEPSVLVELIEDNINDLIDQDAWKASEKVEAANRAGLETALEGLT